MEYRVASISYDRRNFFAHKHEQVFEAAQARNAKVTFARSGGQTLFLPNTEFSELEIFVEGQLTVYKHKGDLVGEYSYGGDFLSVSRCDCLISNFTDSFKNFYIDDAISFLHPGAYNIHHFFFEVLPVIYVNRNELRNRPVLVPTTSGGGKFFSEFNKLLNLNIEFIEVPLKSIVRGKNIKVYGTFPFRIYPVGVVEELRTVIWDFLSNHRITPSNSIVYVGRGDTERNRRKILNETELFKSLDQLGVNYSIVRPGLSSLQETIRELMDAELIIGPTGGALFHQIWSRNIKTLIELKPIRYESMTESEELSKFFGYNYAEIPTYPDSNEFWSHSNQNVDLQLFSKMIELF